MIMRSFQQTRFGLGRLLLLGAMALTRVAMAGELSGADPIKLFEASLPKLRATHQELYDNPEKLQAAWGRFQQDLALAEAAERRGYAQKPEIRARIARLLAEELILSEAENARPLHTITDQEVRSYFEVHKTEFSISPMLGAQEMLWKIDRRVPGNVEQQIARASALARQFGTNLIDSATFLEAARTNSEPDAFRRNGGQLGIFPAIGKRQPTPALSAEAIEALLKLKTVGRVTGPVIQGDEIRLLRLSAFRAARTADFQAVKESIRYRLYAEAREKRLAELARESGWNFEARLDPKIIEGLLPAFALDPASKPELPPAPGSLGLPAPQP
jgi:parvulin-like peptidyl-prolyl isomerase